MEILIDLRQTIADLHRDTDFDAWKRKALALIDAIEKRPCTDENVNTDRLHERLSPREREVMSMLLEGRRLKEIAAALDISVKTVTTHRARLLKKLRLEDNLGLYRYGIRNGLIQA